MDICCRTIVHNLREQFGIVAFKTAPRARNEHADEPVFPTIDLTKPLRSFRKLPVVTGASTKVQ